MDLYQLPALPASTRVVTLLPKSMAFVVDLAEMVPSPRPRTSTELAGAEAAAGEDASSRRKDVSKRDGDLCHGS